ncbi:protein FAR-RED IMPAIRED RESPONSE 1-like [Olea europaea var. sylvestris]|uniref:protein FAR-RED IMPAIRED RESPONSE 1-like n=1 Tax=Olea europaea var. sylvestris TaxID=158386 RepID=UPI000C1D416D|nr:protein FAR-RED IMPAIRED RESPONSE 1-like [Olea europaea var. sylvestris]XP_022870832.1 protein FAR-RED IMPAIRED RESPONSE 1-like [Olea europaea var. sylvestris]
MEGNLDKDTALKNDNGRPDNDENDSGEKMNIQGFEQTSPKEEVEIPEVGMAFRSYEEVRNFYNRYAKSVGFNTAKVSTKNGDDGKQKYFSLACARSGKTPPPTAGRNSSRTRPPSKTECKARMNIAVYDDGRYVVTRVCLDHNHELNLGRPHEFRSSKMVTPQLKRKLEVNDSAVVEMECRSNIANARLLRLGKEDVEAIMIYCYQMQARNSNFFFRIERDEESRIRNVFWADARCRAAYESFGDVIYFDTTYLTKGYDVPLVMFVGVNHHGDSVLFGCGLISSEDTGSFLWLFKSWLTCMLGHSPKAVITDQCRAVQDAVREVFPNSRHCLSLWHIMKKFPTKLKEIAQYITIKMILKNIIYDSVKCNEFEDNWRNLINEYNLHDNEWLKSLYDDRHYWAPVYVKNTFLAGICTTQRRERMNAFFDNHVQSKTTVKQFIELYDNAMKSKIIKENNADFASFSACIPTVTNHPIEKQFQKIYTNEIFKLFQDELRGLIFCNASFVRAEGLTSVFEVTESILEKDGMFSKEVTFGVFLDEADGKLECICHLFEFKGILCRHATSVLIKKNVNNVPSCYVIKRWRKDIKHGYKLLNEVYDNVDGNDKNKRHRKLSPLMLDLQQLGVDSDEKCDFLIKLLTEAKSKLLSVAHADGCKPAKATSLI